MKFKGYSVSRYRNFRISKTRKKLENEEEKKDNLKGKRWKIENGIVVIMMIYM